MNLLTNLKPLINSVIVIVVLAAMAQLFWKGLDAKRFLATLLVGCLLCALANTPEKMAAIGSTLFSWFGL